MLKIKNYVFLSNYLELTILLTPQDYALASNECKQVSCTICGHNYNFWCKSNDFEIVNSCLEQINSVAIGLFSNNKSLSFDRVLLSSFVEVLATLEKTKDINNATAKKYEEIGKNYTNSNIEAYNKTDELNDVKRVYLDIISEKDKKINDLEKIIEKNTRKRASILEEIEKLKAKLEDCYKKINIVPDI